MATRNEENHERSAAGMDYDFPIREKASQLGAALAESGPDALFQEIENLLPESWREHVSNFPMTALVVGLGVGVWLGMRKGEEVIAAGTSLVTAAAMQNVAAVMGSATGADQ